MLNLFFNILVNILKTLIMNNKYFFLIRACDDFKRTKNNKIKKRNLRKILENN